MARDAVEIACYPRTDVREQVVDEVSCLLNSAKDIATLIDILGDSEIISHPVF